MPTIGGTSIGKAPSVSRSELRQRSRSALIDAEGEAAIGVTEALSRLHCHKAKSGIGVFVDDQSKTVRPPGIKQKVCHRLNAVYDSAVKLDLRVRR